MTTIEFEYVKFDNDEYINEEDRIRENDYVWVCTKESMTLNRAKELCLLLNSMELKE